MKKQLLLLTLLFSFFAVSAQFKVIDKKNTVIKDGHVYTFNESGGYDDTVDWNIELNIKNTLDKPIFIQLICDDLVNTDGWGMVACIFETCRNGVNKGDYYPSISEFIELKPGSNGFISMINTLEDKNPKKWLFRIQQFDKKGTNAKKIGKSVRFTYAFDPNMSIEDIQPKNVSIYPTLVESELHVSSKEDLSFSIYDLTGRKVQQSKITSREQKVNISNLTSQPYLVRFTNDKGQSQVKKIIVK